MVDRQLPENAHLGALEYWCIFCAQLPDRRRQAEIEFSNNGLDVNFWQSVHSRTFGVSGMTWPATDLVPADHSVPAGYLGLMIGHWTLWQHLLLSARPGPFLVFEDDVLLARDFEKKLFLTMADAPPDWQIMLVGSPWAEEKDLPPHIAGGVYEIGNGNCWGTHALMLKASSLRLLIDANQAWEMPIDALLNRTTYRRLKTYALCPSLVEQRSGLPASDKCFRPCTCG